MSTLSIHQSSTIHSDHSSISPNEIAIGVVIGRASEYFDFFVYAIASVLVFPSVFFSFESRLDGTLYAFVVFSMTFTSAIAATPTSPTASEPLPLVMFVL